MKMNELISKQKIERVSTRTNNLNKLFLAQKDCQIGSIDREVVDLVRAFETRLDAIIFLKMVQYDLMRCTMYDICEEHKISTTTNGFVVQNDNGEYILYATSFFIEDDLDALHDYYLRIENLQRFEAYFARKGEYLDKEWQDIFIDLPLKEEFNPRLDGCLLRVMNLLQDPSATLYGDTHEDLFVVTHKENGVMVQTIYKKDFDYKADFAYAISSKLRVPLGSAERISEALTHGVYYKLTEPVFKDAYKYASTISEKLKLDENATIKDVCQGKLAVFNDVLSSRYMPDFDVDALSAVVINRVLYIYLPQ